MEYGKYSWECSVAQKFLGKKFSAKGFFVITDVYFQNRNWLETAIMKGNLWLSWEKFKSNLGYQSFLKIA